MMQMKDATVTSKHTKYQIGQVVRHRVYPFRGIIFDVDSEFNNTEEWLQAIPEEIRPRRDQPFYHLFAETDQVSRSYIAYVSEQNLMLDETGEPVNHPAVMEVFSKREGEVYVLRKDHTH